MLAPTDSSNPDLEADLAVLERAACDAGRKFVRLLAEDEIEARPTQPLRRGKPRARPS